jgi:hypothetical protein
MPTFHTPEPISVTVEIGVGEIQIVASERTDTIVDVHPSDAAKKSDVTAAQQTRVEFARGTLLIKAPKGWRQNTFRGGGESIDVQIALPAGSRLHAGAGVATVRASGRLGECQIKTGVGEVHLDEAGPVRLKTGAGDITVHRIVGHAEIATSSGTVQIGSIDGTAVVKNSNGDSWLGEVTGDLRAIAANGRVSVDRSHSTVGAKTANGDIHLGEVARGAVVAQTAYGKVDIGVRTGTAAWLDLHTQFGSVRNGLDDSDHPEPGDEKVEIRARSAFGDIDIRRSSPLANDKGKDQR